MNKIIVIFLLSISIKSVFSTNLVGVENFYENSWRKLSINNILIPEYLIDTINNYFNDRKRLKNIIDRAGFSCETQGENENFWNKEYEISKKTGDVFVGIYNKYILLKKNNQCTDPELKNLEEMKIDVRIFQNNPQVLQDILNYRELLRFKEVLKNTNIAVAPHNDFETNDVLKALSLSGTFCSLEANLFSPCFSGMLVPGQTQDSRTYKIHSCLHGFIGLQVENLYFIPYGIVLNKNNAANHEEAFQVKSLYRRNLLIDQIQLSKIDWNSAYKEEDYIQAEVKGTNDRGNELYKVLKNRQNSNVFDKNNLFPNFMQETNDLPNLLGNDEKYDESFKNNKLGDNSNFVKQYVVIGRPGNPKYQLNDSGFTVVTNLTDNTFANPLRSLRDDRDIKNPPDIGSTNQIASDFPNYYGMSGGIVLEILIDKKSNRNIFARPIGTVWGVERMFRKNETGNYDFISLNSFINKIA